MKNCNLTGASEAACLERTTVSHKIGIFRSQHQILVRGEDLKRKKKAQKERNPALKGFQPTTAADHSLVGNLSSTEFVLEVFRPQASESRYRTRAGHRIK